MEPFFTTKEPGKGMGLGLSLCHRIIESFHGEIDVKSAPGKGTDVTVFLSVLDHDDLRGALKADARGMTQRGDLAALRRLLDEQAEDA